MVISIKRAYAIFEKVKIVGLYVSGGTIFFMMLFIVTDILSRNLFKSSLLGAYEITQYYLMPLAVFPALAYAYGTGIMPRIGILVSKLKQTYQKWITVLLLGFELVLFLLLTYYGWQYALIGTSETLGFSSGGEILPIYPVLYFVPLGFFMLSIEVFFLLIKNLYSKKPSYVMKEN
ncbi:TRAP transporter small permease [Desertibacillus haloalkaliphilus]|uniref:TRAP transporter small permease n=1 Tax=Desertibacillus haloalkaliphilus TaxID=1328930 RepID=UPI001C276D5B|nr:TRAP transporter small permease [Desertibacillus haloalkaliphilus]MBU8907920.1 TRAP transporter small permease [Desertibacillus haloalkaliphilus]